MSTWYQKAMPTVGDVSPFIPEIAGEIKKIAGVKSVWLIGSFVDHSDKPDHVIKDIDVIAKTKFHSGDLMAIDDGRHSPLRMNPSCLEDEGFDAGSVLFTKAYLGVKRYNVDHWAMSRDGKLLHWGLIPENLDDWVESHQDAESYANKTSGVVRNMLSKTSDDKRQEWYKLYLSYVKKYCGGKNSPNGWYASEHKADEIIVRAKQIG